MTQASAETDLQDDVPMTIAHQRGARRVARVVLGVHAFHASLDDAAAAGALVVIGAGAGPGTPAAGTVPADVDIEVPVGPRSCSRGVMVAPGDVVTPLLAGRSLRADSGAAVFCLGVVACDTGGLPPIRALALCGASTARPVRRRWLLSVGLVRSRGVVAVDRTLYLSLPYVDRALIEPPPPAEVDGLFT